MLPLNLNFGFRFGCIHGARAPNEEHLRQTASLANATFKSRENSTFVEARIDKSDNLKWSFFFHFVSKVVGVER